MTDQDTPEDTPEISATSAQHVILRGQSQASMNEDQTRMNEEGIPEIETNPKEIMRSIASYLSLSDVESIGSLSRYSMMTPYRDFHHTRSPRIRKSGNASVNSSYNHSGSNIRLSSATLASIDDTNDDSGNYIQESRGEADTSGPDAAAGVGFQDSDGSHSNSAFHEWGDHYDGDGLGTPGLVALSPIPLDEDEGDADSVFSETSPSSLYGYAYADSHDEERSENDTKTRASLHLKQIQEKLKDAVFYHPQSIRSYCLTSHRTAVKMKKKRLKQSCTLCSKCHMIRREGLDIHEFDGMGRQTYLDECACDDYTDERSHADRPPYEHILKFLSSSIFDNVSLSILLDISFQTVGTSVKVTQASISLSTISADFLVGHLIFAIHEALTILSDNLNPFTLLSNIINLQRKLMGNSVAAGVGSAYPLTHNGFGGMTSADNRSPRSGMVSVGQSIVGGLLRNAGGIRDNVISDKMHRKLNKINPAAKVITYFERDDEVLTQQAKKRVQRMMHYSVPLRPFLVTIEIPCLDTIVSVPHSIGSAANIFENVDFPTTNDDTQNRYQRRIVSERSSSCDTDDEDGSPFMCTPKSFPPTPTSRAHLLARGTKFAEDVVFLARDQLRVEKGLESENEQTKAMAKALCEGKRLAVFNAYDVGAGINLSCGQHCASKIGNDLYSTARGMIPVLRNSFVYFEMTVSTPPLLSMMLHHTSLSIGLSTLEMPLNALVGAWNGSVGLCSTGQVLAGSQWCSPLNAKTYGTNSTIGCLVYLDDDSAFETWDGLKVTANVVFNVDDTVIVPGDPPGFPPSEQVHGDGEEEVEGEQRYSPVLPICVPRDEELFPTLTLHSSQTEVLCRFCAEDILATSRSTIGAPRGVTVYCCDGSVLFDEGNGTESLDSSFDEDANCESVCDGNGLEDELEEQREQIDNTI